MKITGGQRPTRPATTLCSDALWTLITDCWSHESRSRPIMSAVLSLLRTEVPSRAGNAPQGRGRFRPSAPYTDRAEIGDLRPNEQSNVFAEARRDRLSVFADTRRERPSVFAETRRARELIPVPQTRLCGLTLSARSMRELFIPVDAAAGAAIRIVITLPIGQPLPEFSPALTLSSPWTRATCTTRKWPDSLLSMQLAGMQALVRRTDTPFSPMMRLPSLLCHTHMPTLISGARLQYLGISHRSWS
jgi:hypothetical protein